MEEIQFVGLHELDAQEEDILRKLSAEYYEKIHRELKNLTSIQVHIKKYEKNGSKPKYSVHVKVIAPTQIFYSTKAADWDLARTLHKAFKDLEMQIQHKLHTDLQSPKAYC